MHAHLPQSAPPPAAAAGESFDSSAGALANPGARWALAGFFLSGVLLSFLGAILPSWQHHISSDYNIISLYFVGLITGLLGSAWASPKLLERKGIGWTLACACAVAGTAFLYLAFVSPPFAPWWRVAGMAIVGSAAGTLHTAIFYAISPMYRHDPAATVNLAGIFFGLGCFTVALLISGTFYIYTPAAIQVWIAVIPGLAGWGYLKTKFEENPWPARAVSSHGALAQGPSPQAAAAAAANGASAHGASAPGTYAEGSLTRDASPVGASSRGALRNIIAELRTPGAVLLSLLLFFQLGNEWAIAGWLPLFLIQRLGISPATSLWMLALYWLSLLVGRAAAQWVLPRVSHARLLVGSVVASMLGCLILLATNNSFGAVAGILLVGGSFAPIYPLLVEKIGRRFPYYHPGFYNGIFSIALAAGLLAPCTLGYWASVWGVWAVMALPLAGSLVVFVLLVLIWLEARFLIHAGGEGA